MIRLAVFTSLCWIRLHRPASSRHWARWVTTTVLPQLAAQCWDSSTVVHSMTDGADWEQLFLWWAGGWEEGKTACHRAWSLKWNGKASVTESLFVPGCRQCGSILHDSEVEWFTLLQSCSLGRFDALFVAADTSGCAPRGSLGRLSSCHYSTHRPLPL